MTLRPAKLPLNFAGGLSTDQDRKQVPPVKLLDLQNALFTQDTTLVKRAGYHALGRSIEAAGGNYTGAVALASRDNELITFTPTGTYSYRPTADNHALTGSPLSITVRERALAKTGSEQSQVDAGGQNNVTVTAWVDSRGGIWWNVTEESSARVLRPAAQLSTVGTQPRVVPVGTAGVHVYFADHAARRVWVAVIDTANPTAAVIPIVLINDLSTTNIGYDVCTTTLDVALGGSTPTAPSAVTWATDAGTVRLGYVDPTGVLGSGATNLPTTIVAAVFAPTVGTNISVAYSAAQGLAFAAFRNDSPTLALVVWNLLLTAATSTTTAAVAIGVSTRTCAAAWIGTRVYVVVEETTGATSERDTRIWTLYVDVAVGTAVNVIGSPFPVRGLSLASRMFVDSGTPYAYAVHDVPFFSVYLLVRLTDGIVVARTMPTAAHGTQVNGTSTWTSTASPDPTDSRKWRVPLLRNEQLKATSGVFAETGIQWVILDFSDPGAWQAKQLGRGLYLAGACPNHYDGDRWAEMGFHVAPDGTITATGGAGGALTPLGTYTYQVWYEEPDAQGEVHRGPVSVGTLVALAGAENQVTLTGPMYRCGTTKRNVRVCIARGVAGNATELFRVTSVDPSTAGAAANGFITNVTSTDTWTFIDRMSDAVLLGQDPIYTTGGVLSNDPAPMAGGVIAVGKNRLFWTDPVDPTMFRFTQELAEGFGAEMAAPLRQRLDPFGGAVTALEVMDGAIYPFRETAVYVVGGPGPLPDPTVQSDTFSFTPGDRVTSDVGCTTPRSIVTSDIGIAFKSSKGWRLIGRDRRMLDIGQDARLFDTQTVTAATLIPKGQRIILLTSDLTGSALLFDYQRGQWSRFTNHVGLDAIVFGGLYYYLRSDGRILVETPGVYRDDNVHIPMVIETAWIKLSGYLQGWQQIWYAHFLGEYRTPHTLRVRFRLNYELQWSAPFDLDVDTNFNASVYGQGAYGAGPFGSVGSTVYQRRIHIGKPCEAIQFQIQDVEQTANFGAAFELSELLLTGGIKGPAYKLEAARST